MNPYQEELLDHYRNPRYKGRIQNPDFSSDELNPSCGDRVLIAGKIDKEKITQIAFEGSGCVISQAVASMLAEKSLNATRTQILAFNVETVQNLVGIPLGPTRLQCALLPLEALQNALLRYQKR
jgi:nitrogen fixation protein NifU and related proteins